MSAWPALGTSSSLPHHRAQPRCDGPIPAGDPPTDAEHGGGPLDTASEDLPGSPGLWLIDELWAVDDEPVGQGGGHRPAPLAHPHPDGSGVDPEAVAEVVAAAVARLLDERRLVPPPAPQGGPPGAGAGRSTRSSFWHPDVVLWLVAAAIVAAVLLAWVS